MMQDRDAIIILKEFDSGIDASLAKSKLDANDIPCFLTQENMALMYQGALGIRVRLHVFEKDKENADRILSDIQLDIYGETPCPRCNSTRIERDFSTRMSSRFLGILNLIFVGPSIPPKKIYRCLQCKHEF